MSSQRSGQPSPVTTPGSTTHKSYFTTQSTNASSASENASSPKSSPTGLRKQFLDAEAIPVTTQSPNDVGTHAFSIPRRQLLIPSSIDYNMHKLGENSGPEIQWNPSYETYLKRVKRLSEEDRANAIVRENEPPPGFPYRVEAPWVWQGGDFLGEEGEARYIVYLTEFDIAEIEQALAYFKTLRKSDGTDTGPDDVNTATFPIPKLHKKLEAVAHQLHTGIGFAILRGLTPSRYSSLENLIIYLGVTAPIAPYRGVQDSSGNMLIHVLDLGTVIPNSDLRQSPYAHNAQPFHNDVCDVLAMYVQNTAAEGGASYLASCAMVYNEIMSKGRADILHTLSKDDWVFDKFVPPPQEPVWRTRALLYNFKIPSVNPENSTTEYANSPGFCFSRRPITGSPTSPHTPGIPLLTERQAEAIDMVHFTAVEISLKLQLCPGDIQLINNLAVFHARDGFRDSRERKRHILRLWLRNEKLAWKTPEGLKRTWKEKYGSFEESEWRRKAKWNVLPGIGVSRERVLYRSDSCS
jgi:hypothetical protein